MPGLKKPSVVVAIVEAAVGSVPVLGPAFAAAVRYAVGLDEWHIRQVAEGVAQEVADPDVVTRRILADERLVSMLVQAIESGRRSPWEAKRITMGRVVGQALSDDALIDDHAARITALAALEAPHFRYLVQLIQHTAVDQLTTGPIPQPYRAALYAAGAIEEDPAPMSKFVLYHVSPFGHHLLEWLREVDPSIGGAA